MSSLILKVLVIDDEEPARSELGYLLKQQDNVEIVASVANGKEGWDAVLQYQPHIVFLDIHMPGDDGLTLAQRILSLDTRPMVVFATAHEEYAVRAFELNAVDYILKPFTQERVAQCLEKAQAILMRNISSTTVTRLEKVLAQLERENKPQTLVVEKDGRLTVVNHDDIIMVSSENGQVKIYTTKGQFSINSTLQELSEKLSTTHFFRTHRAFIVNLAKIREVIPWFNGTYNLILDGMENVEVPVSRHQAPKLRKILFQ